MYFTKPNMFSFNQTSVKQENVISHFRAILASSRTWSDSQVGLVAEISGRWYRMACLGKKLGEQILGVLLFLTLTQMRSCHKSCASCGWTKEGCKTVCPPLWAADYVCMDPLGVLPMPGKPDNDSGVCNHSQRRGRERSELPCYHTGNTWSFSWGRQTSQLF